MSNKTISLRLFIAAAILFAGLCLLSLPGKAQGSGEKTYKAKCAMCHGPDGKGETAAGKSTKARDFCSDEVAKETDEEWTTIVAKGKNKMPAYDKKMTDAEIKETVAYIRSVCKK